jgi:VanZ family protein
LLNVAALMPPKYSQVKREAAWPVALALTITLCSGFPAAVPTSGWFETDKLGHFAAYGALATGVVRMASLRNWLVLGPWWAILFASAYGIGDEFRQSLTLVRTFDLADWVADTIGAVVAVVLYLRWPWYRRLLEIPLRRRLKPQVEISPELMPNTDAENLAHAQERTNEAEAHANKRINKTPADAEQSHTKSLADAHKRITDDPR